ncbi:MAG: efflux RND transporter periplasmic adaptor subunit [Rikenellaceae bacterium]
MKRISVIFAALLVSCGSSDVKWDATGVFEATEIVVSAEGNGALNEFVVTEGAQLSQGALVGVIDTVQLAIAREQLIANRSGVLSRTADVQEQIASINEQIRWQESERARFTKLLREGAATQKQVDDLTNQIAVLRKQLTASGSTLKKGNSSISDEGRSIELRIAQIDDQIRRCYVHSPISGTVLAKYAEQHEFTATGKPLFSIADMEHVYLRAYVTASLLSKVKLGQKVKVYSDFGAKESREYEGIVEWISDKAEFTPKMIQTRDERANTVYAVKIGVKNDGLLKIGMYGQLVL